MAKQPKTHLAGQWGTDPQPRPVCGVWAREPEFTEWPTCNPCQGIAEAIAEQQGDHRAGRLTDPDTTYGLIGAARLNARHREWGQTHCAGCTCPKPDRAQEHQMNPRNLSDLERARITRAEADPHPPTTALRALLSQLRVHTTNIEDQARIDAILTRPNTCTGQCPTHCN